MRVIADAQGDQIHGFVGTAGETEIVGTYIELIASRPFERMLQGKKFGIDVKRGSSMPQVEEIPSFFPLVECPKLGAKKLLDPVG